MSKYGKLVDEQIILLKFAYETGLVEAIMWIEESLEDIANAYDMSFSQLHKEYNMLPIGVPK